jgi:carboxylesterase
LVQIHNPHLEGGPFYLTGGPLGVLLIHGLTATTAEVRPLAEWLHRLGYSVAAPLLPGHYTQPADLNRVQWQNWAESVDEMYNRLKTDCQRIVAGGESTGALLALNLAGEHPEIDALLLYAPALKLNFSRLGGWRIRLLAPFVKWAPKKNMDSDMPWQGYTVNPLKGVIQLLTLQVHIHPRLPQITQPVLIVQGRLDLTVDARVPGILINGLGSNVKEVHWMGASTHCVILDREREIIYRLTQTFLSRVWNHSHA